MNSIFTDYLFNKGFFVEEKDHNDHAFEACVALAKMFGIEIISAPEKASLSMVRKASALLGENVPKPFYKNFPDSVKTLGIDELLIDQLLNYQVTYGWGMFNEARHSIFEEEIQRKVFREKTEIRPYRIITEEEAKKILEEAADNMLQSSRPLNNFQYDLLRNIVLDLGCKVEKCNCKDTIIRLIADTRNIDYASMLKLSDVIRLAEELQYRITPDNTQHLTLKNKDRRIITAVLDRIFADGSINTIDCFEKKKRWAGLLHSIHYSPLNDEAESFVNAMRGRENRSVYSLFEKAIGDGDIPKAVDILLEYKGGAALLRSLTYLLSRCRTEEDTLYVLDHIHSDNKIVLLQLIFNYRSYSPLEPRTFMFTRFNKLCVHREDPIKAAQKTKLSDDVIQNALSKLNDLLKQACEGTVSRAYIDPEMKKTTLPIQENTSMSGVGILPKGSRRKIPEGQKIRGFTYWEKVDDIDLSIQGLTENGDSIELSWRTMAENQSEAICYSGDVTSGYDGGSEYFDVDLNLVEDVYPEIRYLVFCNNVYSRCSFSDCYCAAGYMVRDELDSGEVFEPKTVESSFRITCDSREAFLFALDLTEREVVWLNISAASSRAVAGTDNKNYLKKYLNITDVLNVYDFAAMLASEIVKEPEEADVVFSDRQLPLKEGAQQIRSIDTEKLIALIN